MSFKLVVDRPPPGTSTVPDPFAVANHGGRGQMQSANPTLGNEQVGAIVWGSGKEKCDVQGSGKEKCDKSQGREGSGNEKLASSFLRADAKNLVKRSFEIEEAIQKVCHKKSWRHLRKSSRFINIKSIAEPVRSNSQVR